MVLLKIAYSLCCLLSQLSKTAGLLLLSAPIWPSWLTGHSKPIIYLSLPLSTPISFLLSDADLQELRDLEAAYQAKRRVMVDEALNKLHADYDKQRSELARRHQEELAALKVSSQAKRTSLSYMQPLFSVSSSSCEICQQYFFHIALIIMTFAVDWGIKNQLSIYHIRSYLYLELSVLFFIAFFFFLLHPSSVLVCLSFPDEDILLSKRLVVSCLFVCCRPLVSTFS